MNSRITFYALIACLTLQACSSGPREFTPALAVPAANQLEFDAVLPQVATVEATTRVICEAPPGQYQTKDIPHASRTALSGRIRLLEAKPDQIWAPAAGFVFKLVGVDTHVGVQAFVDPDRPGKLTIGLRKPLDDSPVVLMRVPRNVWVQVSARVEGKVLTVATSTKHRSIKLAQDVDRPILMCSSGRFEFEI